MFQGVPGKTSVQILPTLNCLIALEDNPPWVLSLDEVEVAYFERVQLSLKNFDLVFVYKNFERPVEKIRSIDTRSLDTIQSYLKYV
jgi:nucleosome binding factor SPN SPT16 subunit